MVVFAIAILIAIRSAEVLYENNVDTSVRFPTMVPLEIVAVCIVLGLSVLVVRANRRMR